MGIFDKSVERSEFDRYKVDVQGKIEAIKKEVESIRPEVKHKFDELRIEIKNKATDDEETARVAAANAVECESRIKATESSVEEALNALVSYRDGAQEEFKAIEKERALIEARNSELLVNVNECEKLYSEISSAKSKMDEAVDEVSRSVVALNDAVDKSKSLPQAVEEIKALLEETKSQEEDMRNLVSHAMKKKSEIDDLHREVIGYDVKDEDGDSQHVDGLKDELKKAYLETKSKVEDLEGNIDGVVSSITEKYEKGLDGQKQAFEKFLAESKGRVKAVDEELKALLPGGMAAGLSAAYEAKTKDEVTSLKKFESVFQLTILGLVIVSLLPFSIDIYLMKWRGADIVSVIKDTPNLIVSILPLYFPILWLAYSTNKKLNLSKRLIEEYTHKSVLGKTFSGLSNQIETLPRESTVKEELRTRLLFNLLQVSSENPGKLITDYNKSDHPLMEALEKSAKLSEAVEALGNLPGFKALAKRLSDSSEEIVKRETKKVEDGLVAQDALDQEAGNNPFA